MPEQARLTTHRSTSRHRARGGIPSTAEALPRFAPSPRSQGEAYAERILDAFRKELAEVKLQATATPRRGAAQHRRRT